MSAFFDGLKSVLFTSDGKVVGVRSAMALIPTGVAGYLWAAGNPVPSELIQIVVGFNSFYFGIRAVQSTTNGK